MLFSAVVFLGFGGLFGRAAAVPHVKRQCAATLDLANTMANALQSTFWGGNQYNGGELWTDANAYEDLNNLMLATGATTWAYVNTDSSTAQLGASNPGNWDNVFHGSYDDAQWVILMYWKIRDYMVAHGQDASKFMASAAGIYDYVSAQYDTTTCGGGVWWSSAHNYKNAVTNELYLLTSASGYLRTGNQTYLANAKKEWNWLKGSGMRNAQGLWNDGLTSSCQNNGQTTWIYNQGVIASGLAALGVATQDTSLFDQAEITLDAAISHLTTNNILKESCDNASNSTCNNDQVAFKGIFMKHLQYYLDMVNDASRTAKYSSFIGAQESAVFHYAKNANNVAGSVWYAPNNGGSIFSSESAASGLSAVIADAKYGPC